MKVALPYFQLTGVVETRLLMVVYVSLTFADIGLRDQSSPSNAQKVLIFTTMAGNTRSRRLQTVGKTK
jgi:hypothetical protein